MAMVKMTVSYYFDIKLLDGIENDPEDIAAYRLREITNDWDLYLEAMAENCEDIELEDIKLA